jgi:hypothetical protein
MRILKRAKELASENFVLFATPNLQLFLKHNYTSIDFENDKSLLDKFTKLDDSDLMASIKVWCDCDDKILAKLSSNLLERKLFKIEMQSVPFSAAYKKKLVEKVCKRYKISVKEAQYFVFNDKVNNSAYNANKFNINILMNNGNLVDVAKASDQLNIQSLSKTVTKYFICYPKELLD